MALSPGSLCDAAELTCTALAARARARVPQLSAGPARAASRPRMRMPCTPGFRICWSLRRCSANRAIGVDRFDACALTWGDRVEQGGAGEERGEGGVPSGGGASEPHTHA